MSQSRQCLYLLANDSAWYLQLGMGEGCWEDHECTWYGPFDTYEDANQYQRTFSNPGDAEVDRSGTEPPPNDAVSPIQKFRF